MPRRLPDRERAFRTLGHHERAVPRSGPGREPRRGAAGRSEGGLPGIVLDVAGREPLGRQQDALSSHGPEAAVQPPDQQRGTARLADGHVRHRRQPTHAGLRKVGDAASLQVCRRRRSRDGADAVDQRHDKHRGPGVPLLVVPAAVIGRRLPRHGFLEPAPRPGHRRKMPRHPGRLLQHLREVGLRRRQAAAGRGHEIEEIAAGIRGVIEPASAFFAPHLHRDGVALPGPPLAPARVGGLAERRVEEILGMELERGLDLPGVKALPGTAAAAVSRRHRTRPSGP